MSTCASTQFFAVCFSLLLVVSSISMGPLAGTAFAQTSDDAEFTVEYSVASSLATTEAPVTVTAEVTNTGNSSGETTVPLYINGDQTDSRTVTVDAGSTETVSFTADFSSQGQQSVSVGDAEPTTVTVGGQLFDAGSVDTFELSSRLAAWNRFLFPLRTDTGTAATQLDNRNREISESSGNILGLKRDQVGTYTAGNQTTVSFKPSRAQFDGSRFEEVPVQLISVRVDEPQELSVGTIEGIVKGEVAATSRNVDRKVLNASGETTFDYTPTESGQYVLFFAAPSEQDSEFQTTAEGFDVEGNMTLLGYETLSVQQSASDVQPATQGDDSKTVIRGKDAKFNVSVSGADGQQVNHLLLVYDNATFSESNELIEIDGSISTDSITEQTTIATTVDRVDGVKRVENQFTIVGVDFTNDKLSRTQGIGSAIDFIAESAGGPPPGANTYGDKTVLSGSVTAVRTDPDTELAVGTTRNFSTGTYRWVHLARVDGQTVTTTDAGTLTVTDGTQLDVDVNQTTAVYGDSINVSVTRSDTGEPVDTTVAVGDTEIQTGSDGFETITVEQTGNLTVEAAAPSREFYADQTALSVQPLSLNLTANRTSPVAGDPVQLSVTRIDTGDPVNATIETGAATLTTGSDGTVTTVLSTPGEQTLTANPTSEEFGADTLTIDVRAPANISVVDYGVNQTRLTVSERASVTAQVENTGDVEGNESVRFRVAGAEIEQNQTVRVDPGQTETVEFILDLPEPGLYNVTVGDAPATTVAVQANLPYADTFDNGPDGWIVEADAGTGTWTTTDGGSINLTATGDPGSRLIRDLGPLNTGTQVVVNYSTQRVADRGGTVSAQIQLASGETIVLDTDDSETGYNGTLVGTVPTEVPGDASVAVAVSAPTRADTGTNIRSVRLQAPPELNIIARTDSQEFDRFGRVTATEPITFTVQRVDTGEPINTTLSIEDFSAGYKDSIEISNGSVVWESPAAGDYTVIVDRPINRSVFGLEVVDIDVTRQTVPLNITANQTTIEDEESVTFTVRRSDTGEPTNATVEINGERKQTDADGTLTHTFTDPGVRTITAGKQQTDISTFSTDSIEITVEPGVAVENFDLRLGENETGTVQFQAGQSLTDIQVEIIHRNGDSATFTDFNSTNTSTGVLYQRPIRFPGPGVYTAMLERAETANNKSGAIGQKSGLVVVGPGETNLTAPASTTQPTIDGRLDDDAWIDAAEYSVTFENRDGNQFTDGTVYLTHDGEYLYVGVNSGLADGAFSRGALLIDGNSDGQLNGSETVPQTDIGIGHPGPSASSDYREYAILGENNSSEPPEDVAAGSAGNPVTYEYRVPLSVLGRAPGETISAEIVAHDAVSGPENTYYWAFRPEVAGPEASDWPGISLEQADVSPAYTYQPTTPTVSEPTVFNASTTNTSVGTVETYAWDFGSDGTVERTGEQVRYAFTKPGTYNVTLRVRTDTNQTATVTRQVTVESAAPASKPFIDRFEQNATNWRIEPARVTQSTPTVTGAWTPAFGGTVGLRANASLGDAALFRPVTGIERGDEVGAAFIPANETTGSGTVEVVVVTPAEDVIPIASAQYNESTTEPQLVSGFAPETVPDGSRVVVVHTANTGTQTVHIGAVAVQEGALPPEPEIDVNTTTPSIGASVALDGTATTDPDGNIENATFNWYFGTKDTVDATGQRVTTAFTEVGGQPVWLEVTDEDGNTTTVREQLTVLPSNADSLVFADDFEDDPVGSYPDGWTANGNRNQQIVASPAASGNRSFELQGRSGGCWEAISNHPVSAPTNGTLIIQADVRTTITDEGCHPSTVDLNLRTSDRYWSTGQRTGLLEFKTDGTIVGADGNLDSLGDEQFQWITVRIVYERADDVVRLTYTKDGAVIGTATREAKSFEDALSYLSISSGDTTVYYDDIVVAANTTTPVAGNAEPPVPSITVNESEPATGTPVQFDGSNTTDTDGNVTLFAWDFDNDGEIDATGETVTHRFLNTGQQTVTLTVADDDLSTTTTNTTVAVSLREELTPFSNTAELDPENTDPDSLAGAVRVDEETQPVTTASSEQQTTSVTKFTVDTNSTSETTIYIKRSALPTDASLSETLLFVDGRPTDFFVDESVGAADETWVVFTLEKSAGTVTFTTNTEPQLDTTRQSQVNYVGAPIQFQLSAAAPDGTIQSFAYELPDGTRVSLLDQAQTDVTRQVNITLDEPTWNTSTGQYESEQVTFVIADDTGEVTVENASVTVYIQGDTTGDGVVDLFDAVVIARSYQADQTDQAYRQAADINNDGVVDIQDAALVGQSWNQNASSLEE